MGQGNILTWFLNTLSEDRDRRESEREKRRGDLESSFDRDFYTVKDARAQLEDRGLSMHLETLRRKIRAKEVKVSGSARKTLIHKGELTRLLMQTHV